jgi:hypothetical protein
MSTETAVPLLLSAGFVGALGVLIKYFGMVDLIAGYDPESVTDDEGVADFVGTQTIYVAALSAAVGVAEYAGLSQGSGVLWAVYAAAVVLIAVRVIRGARQYEHSR